MLLLQLAIRGGHENTEERHAGGGEHGPAVGDRRMLERSLSQVRRNLRSRKRYLELRSTVEPDKRGYHWWFVTIDIMYRMSMVCYHQRNDFHDDLRKIM